MNTPTRTDPADLTLLQLRALDTNYQLAVTSGCTLSADDVRHWRAVVDEFVDRQSSSVVELLPSEIEELRYA